MPINYTPEYWDHERDLRKVDQPPHRLAVPVPAAFEIASLVKAVDLHLGAQLIEQYAQTIAAGARLDGVARASDRILETLAQPVRL